MAAPPVSSLTDGGRVAGQKGDGSVQHWVAAAQQIVDRGLDDDVGRVAGDLDGTASRIGDIPVRDPHDEIARQHRVGDRKSTRLNSSHRCISYAVFCLKKKKKN